MDRRLVVARVSTSASGGVVIGAVAGDVDPWLTTADVCRVLRIAPDTWRAYVNRGQAPAPDDPDLGRPANRRTLRWRESTVRRYVANRKRRAWKLPK
jgi:hypothetical protein